MSNRVVDLQEMFVNEKKNKRVQSAVQGDVGVDTKIYMTLDEVAKLLDRSIYRIRQMYWEGKLGEGVKGTKKIYVKREVVKKVKEDQGKKKVQNSTVELRRFGKRVVLGVEIVLKLVKSDKEIADTERSAFLALLSEYGRKGDELVKKNSK